ncbi:hypothetical protein B0H16DRAFT_1462057 [Mycena metata]|uniref:Bacteriophage T5 Orf172 DNA-binding domain-containing protein n=1 Tax=Mycena metata TaxID=1033252 RepID=A0AAD7IQR7_9AGAR|nr:hypothetical protein B0H16DRAFT_1462057 [Mycena metata]
MAPGRTLKFFIRAFESHDHARIADLSDPYDDGPGFNYLVRRRRRTDIDALNLGVITQAQLDARTEYKWGETERPITERQREYRRCEAMYEIVWIRIYSTPVRKLSEGLVHAEFRIAGLQAPDVLCSCGTNHREWFLLDPLEGDTAAALEYKPAPSSTVRFFSTNVRTLTIRGSSRILRVPGNGLRNSASPCAVLSSGSSTTSANARDLPPALPAYGVCACIYALSALDPGLPCEGCWDGCASESPERRFIIKRCNVDLFYLLPEQEIGRVQM